MRGATFSYQMLEDTLTYGFQLVRASICTTSLESFTNQDIDLPCSKNSGDGLVLLSTEW
jgi:hypothetical protein